MVKEFDVFIAYHGTSDPSSTFNTAKELRDFLSKEPYNFKCAIDDGDTNYKKILESAEKSRMFLFVANENCLKSNKINLELNMNKGVEREIGHFASGYDFITSEIHDKMRAKVFCMGLLQTTDVNKMNYYFSGSNHFTICENKTKLDIFVEIADWISHT